MSKYLVIIVLASCFILLALPGLAAANDHGDRVCIYKHDNFHGHAQCYRPGDEVSDLKHAEIGSIRVFGQARATLYEDRDFFGRTIDFSADVRDLNRLPLTGSKNWHDHIGSMRVTTDTALNSQPLYPPDYFFERLKPSGIPGTIDEGACVYEKPNFEGPFQCWSSGTAISDLNIASWQDRIASVRIIGEGRLVGYQNKEYRGERLVIDHDVPDLKNVPMGISGNWNDEMSSVEVQ